MQAKILTILFIALLATFASAADIDFNSILKPEGSMITGRGTATPVIVPLSAIPQHKEILREVEEFNSEEGELLAGEINVPGSFWRFPRLRTLKANGLSGLSTCSLPAVYAKFSGPIFRAWAWMKMRFI